MKHYSAYQVVAITSPEPVYKARPMLYTQMIQQTVNDSDGPILVWTVYAKVKRMVEAGDRVWDAYLFIKSVQTQIDRQLIEIGNGVSGLKVLCLGKVGIKEE